MSDASFCNLLSCNLVCAGLLSIASAACGGVEVGSGGASSSATGASQAAGTSTTTTTATSTTVTTVTTGSGAQLYATPTLGNLSFNVDCQPVVGADPVNGQFTATYLNLSVVPQTLLVKSAKLTLTKGNATLEWPFTVAPGDSGPIPPMQSASVVHTKIAGSGGSPAGGAPCGFCGGTWSLEVRWAGGSADLVATAGAGAIQCAF